MKKLTFLLILVSWSMSSLSAEEFRAIGATGQLFGNKLEAELSTSSLSYRDAIWPGQAEIEEEGIALAEIASGVLDEGEDWIRTMVKAEWIPESLNGHFVPIRIRKPYFPPQEVDYLITRYHLREHQIQIMESGAAVRILIVPPTSRAEGMPIEDYIVESARLFLDLPGDTIESIEVKGRTSVLGEDGILYRGIMDCHDKEEPAARAWWHHSYVWSDGQRVYFSLVERDGQPVKPQATFGIPPRF